MRNTGFVLQTENGDHTREHRARSEALIGLRNTHAVFTASEHCTKVLLELSNIHKSVYEWT